MNASDTHTTHRPALTLSFLFCGIALIGIFCGTIFLHPLLKAYADLSTYTSVGPLSRHAAVLILLYLCLAVAASAVVCLLCLLLKVKHGRVFTKEVCRLVSIIAGLVMAEGGLFALVGITFPLSFAITFVAITIGLCLLVARGILKDAIHFKEENDATI